MGVGVTISEASITGFIQAGGVIEGSLVNLIRQTPDLMPQTLVEKHYNFVSLVLGFEYNFLGF